MIAISSTPTTRIHHFIMNSRNTLVLDAGSLAIKLGVSGDDSPKHVIPAIVARVDDKLFLEDGLTPQGDVTYPFKNNLIANKTHFDFLLTSCLSKLPLKDLVLGNNFASKTDRLRVCESLFEKAQLSSVFLA
jgi:actin-related protein